MSFVGGHTPPNQPTNQGPAAVPVPFLRRAVGAGDVVAAITRVFGIQPCTPCEARKRAMNQGVQFVPWGGQR